MTNPTADAAKQDDHRAKWTLASGDEMFLVGEDGVGLNAGGHVIVKRLREWHALANTSPQPAPPEGEPDDCYERVPHGTVDVKNFQLQELHESIDKLLGVVQRGQSLCASATNDVARDKFNEGLNALPRWIRDRLGLAARPKVEDVDIQEAIEWLRYLAKNWSDGVAGATPHDSPAWGIARLLERLAADRNQWRIDCLEFEREKKAAEAKLAEREAELATAYEVIELCRSALEGAPSLIAREAIAAWDTKCDAARQQQKASSEATAREEE